MSKLKHTPGPHDIFLANDNRNYTQIITNNNIWGVHSESHVDEIEQGNIHADCRLFGAAPELLDDKIKDFKEIGTWLSAALDDPTVCEEFKSVIRKWFERFDTFEKATGFEIGELED